MSEVSEQDLENRVVSLKQVDSFELPSIHRATNKFLVVGGSLFSQDYYGEVIVFNLRNKRAISRIVLRNNTLQDIATDGDFLYLHLKEDFDIKPDHVLIAKCLKTEGGRSEEEYVECEFVGKPVKDLMGEGLYGRRAVEGDVSGRIVAFTLDKIFYGGDSIVFDPSILAEESHTFLVHNDMSLVHLSSGHGYAIVGYNYHFGEGGCDTSFRLKKGEISSTTETELDGGVPLIFYDGRNIDGQIHAMVDAYDESFETPELERDRSVRLPVVMDRTIHSSYGILDFQRSGNVLHVLYDQIRDNVGKTTQVRNPNRLISYEVSIKKLVEE